MNGFTRDSNSVLVHGPVDGWQLLRQAVDGANVTVALALHGQERGLLGLRNLAGKFGPLNGRGRQSSSRHRSSCPKSILDPKLFSKLNSTSTRIGRVKVVKVSFERDVPEVTSKSDQILVNFITCLGDSLILGKCLSIV